MIALDRYGLLAHALEQRPAGLVCEFGVYRGDTLAFIADRVPGDVHGFDSFQGLPERWRDGFEGGAFATKPPTLRAPNVQIHTGEFADSLPMWLGTHPLPIGFAHVDCDLYSSTATVLEHIGPRLADGAVLVFDEFTNYPGWPEGEFKAFVEWIGRSSRRWASVGHVRGGEQAAFKVWS